MLQEIPNLQLDAIQKAPIGFSGDQVYLVKEGYQGKDVVVKLSKRKEVYEEGINLQWLASKIEVPKVYQVDQINGWYYTIMEWLPGRMFQELFNDISVEEGITLYAKLIHQFHQIDATNLPYNHSTKQKLEEVINNVKDNKVTTTYFEREVADFSPKQVLDKLCSIQIEEDDKVLCHGDVCMPNIIMQEKALAGFIDVVQLGVCDRHLDLAIALRTIRYNLEARGITYTKEHRELFINVYGDVVIDKDKLCFYFLLDELTIG